MKKTLLIVSVILSAVACKNEEDKTTEPEASEPKAANGYAYSETFNQSMNNVLNAYYNLKDAFVASDTVKINTEAVVLKDLLDSFKLEEVQQFDTLGFSSINGRPGDVAAEISGMLGEKELEKKRESFEMVSNAFYDMVRVIKPTGATVYYQYCPMAFDNAGANWLSQQPAIRNPYFGDDMLDCGENRDSVNFVQ